MEYERDNEALQRRWSPFSRCMQNWQIHVQKLCALLMLKTDYYITHVNIERVHTTKFHVTT